MLAYQMRRQTFSSLIYRDEGQRNSANPSLRACLLSRGESPVFPVASAQNVGGKIQNIVLVSKFSKPGGIGEMGKFPFSRLSFGRWRLDWIVEIGVQHDRILVEIHDVAVVF